MLRYDREIIISRAGNRKALFWPGEKLMWSEFAERLQTPVRGEESYTAYSRMQKSRQDELKDVGGFVGGALKNGRRKNTAVLGRDLVTLDLDAIPAGHTDDVRRAVAALGCASCVYSTRKHDPGKPRLRVIFPLDRTVTADEYEPIARRMGEKLDITYCDPTTFQAVRMMYFPSVCQDGEYVYDVTDAPFLSAGGVLNTYKDWRDQGSWPQAPGQAQAQKNLAGKQEDPTEKRGLVGAFCRKYGIRRAMDELLPGTYLPTAEENRYTYAAGSTFGGAIVYDDKFLYSHHGTDPCGGKLVNAFDLVRLHKFGGLDDQAALDTPANRWPSYQAMTSLAAEDEDVRDAMARERYERLRDEFTPLAGGEPGEREESLDWLKELGRQPLTGKYDNTIDNMLLVLRHDARVRGRVARDLFEEKTVKLGALPWDARTDKRDWTDDDDAGLRWFMEKAFEITGAQRVSDAVALIARENGFDDVKDYLTALPPWDGIPRLDRLLIEYLGADDTPYTRAVTRKTFAAAVRRAMDPGCKFDYLLTLIGAQGIGKSTLLRMMGGERFSDSINTFEGKEAAEQLRSVWFGEIPEYDRFSKYEASLCKQFISRQNDIYREAYGRRTTAHPRRCVLVATVNKETFLTDETGNRRFWPVVCRRETSLTEEERGRLAIDRGQLWAEAYAAWQLDESAFLPEDLEREAKTRQSAAAVVDEWSGLIEEFIARPLPPGWENRTIPQRRAWWANDFGRQAEGGQPTEKRTRVCAIEIWCELLGRDASQWDQKAARRINAILTGLEGWKSSVARTSIYGVQRCYTCMLHFEKCNKDKDLTNVTL